MCELKRRDLLLGASAMLLYGCGDAEKYNQAKDTYPVSSTEIILHWGKNNKIILDSDFYGNPSISHVNQFEAGVNQWSSTLKEIGVDLSFSGTADVRVHWYSASEMLSQTGSLGVLGYASSSKTFISAKI